jgi:ABC-type uncharacterized transport system substrate-binding protein
MYAPSLYRRSVFQRAASITCITLLAACQPSPVRTDGKMSRVLLVGAGAAAREGITDGLRSLGYVLDRTLVVDSRSAPDPNESGSAELRASLFQTPPDVIVTVNTPAAVTVKRATSTIPIVAINITTPIASGLVESLARPGGNLTGVAISAPGLYAKWVDLLRQILPDLRRIAVLVDLANAGNVAGSSEVRAAAEQLGVVSQEFRLASADDVEAAFTTIAASPPDALIDLASPLLLQLPPRVIAIGMRHPLPAITILRDLAVGGLLMSYGPSLPAIARRAAAYVDKILKGANPGELPVEQPREFELVVNLKTARLLGITIPPDFARQVTEWIE